LMSTEIDVVLTDLDLRAGDAAESANADIQQAEESARRLGELERRVESLVGLSGPLPRTIAGTSHPRSRAVSPESEEPDWGQLVADARTRLARRGVSSYSLDVLLDDQSLARIERRFSGEFRMRTQLDRYDVVAMASAGVIAGLVDFFFVRIPADMTYPLSSGLSQQGSPLTDWLHSQSVPHAQGPFSNWAKVAYDRVNLSGTGSSIPGFNAKTHRFLTPGHDPLLGFVFGILDICHGGMTAINNGTLIYVPGTRPPVQNPLEILLLQVAHLISDASTDMGIPTPGWTAFGLADFGSFSSDNLTVAQVAKNMYLKGYDLRHFITQTLSVAAAELTLHAYWYAREALDPDWAAQVERESGLLDINSALEDRHGIRRLGSHPRYQAMALGTHTIGAAANAGKIALVQGNPLALNYAQWARFLHAAYRYSTRFFIPPTRTLANAAWLNEVAIAGGWPALDWETPEAPRLAAG
jgi:hypothetical protein